MNNVPDNIVEIRDAYKSYFSSFTGFSYTRTVVLKGVNMTVQRGSIYALLGPSGCGKTTLLKGVLSRGRLANGEIKVMVKDRSNIGYMPQNTALVEEITVKETLNYYGWIYNKRGDELEERKKILFSFLDIQAEHKKIVDLSGGQKRRVSLCLALLHNPELLILDEPTVGIDPILSHNIWRFLLELSTVEKKTIILTTHYIEEARQSNKVGMMRGGVLVLEGEPQSVIERYDCNTLEDVFVKLSFIQESEKVDENADTIKNDPKPSVKPKLPLPENKLFSFNCFMGYFLKNAYFLKYSSLGWFLLFFIPISSCLMFQYSLGRSPRGLKLGIINEELLQQHGNCQNFSNLTCFPAFCGYLPLLEKKNIIPVSYNDTEIAFENFIGGKIQGILHISENFTESLQERLYKGMSTSYSVINQSEVKVWLDTTNKVIGDFLESTIYSIFFDYLVQLSQTCQWPVNHTLLPIQFKEPVYGKTKPEFSEFSVPGVLSLLEFFLPIAYVIPILQDKRSGIVERSLISGLTNLEILASYAAIAMLLFFLQTACNAVILYGIYGHVFEGSVILAFMLLTLVGLNGLCFGLFVAVLFDREIAASFAVIGLILANSTISGKNFEWSLKHSSITL
ncbi:ABC transporter G family member 23 [Halyomorpha halys]|uniref:ABC transporter G family member 23 n=1 Tax=Halyomorpha halys TaxID=286706 RepID=UPI0034D2AD24